ncbi:MAG TPA: hypothetical protein VFJ53_02990 [Solirubrobacterales bacterium]|nr:hypothetical protein [Solirubrobacterales bacterium]
MPPEVEQKAIKALVDFGGCKEPRAKELLQAWKKVFEIEALAVVGGEERVATSVTDQRVERVRQLVTQLGKAALPNPYELGVLLRITPIQARTVLRNWRARYPDSYEGRMSLLAAKGKKSKGGTTKKPTWVVEYDDYEVFEYAVDKLRRSRLQQGLHSDSGDLKLSIPKSTKTSDGSDALGVLGIE